MPYVSTYAYPQKSKSRLTAGITNQLLTQKHEN